MSPFARVIERLWSKVEPSGVRRTMRRLCATLEPELPRARRGPDCRGVLATLGR